MEHFKKEQNVIFAISTKIFFTLPGPLCKSGRGLKKNSQQTKCDKINNV